MARTDKLIHASIRSRAIECPLEGESLFSRSEEVANLHYPDAREIRADLQFASGIHGNLEFYRKVLKRASFARSKREERSITLYDIPALHDERDSTAVAHRRPFIACACTMRVTFRLLSITLLATSVINIHFKRRFLRALHASRGVFSPNI